MKMMTISKGLASFRVVSAEGMRTVISVGALGIGPRLCEPIQSLNAYITVVCVVLLESSQSISQACLGSGAVWNDLSGTNGLLDDAAAAIQRAFCIYCYAQDYGGGRDLLWDTDSRAIDGDDGGLVVMFYQGWNDQDGRPVGQSHRGSCPYSVLSAYTLFQKIPQGNKYFLPRALNFVLQHIRNSEIVLHEDYDFEIQAKFSRFPPR
ncbi:hypothetical protein BY996DRAFT_6426236 [Phakopsora pachyrhizi]|nr:hypothetical protein BY996DRAFT_6426236 [Phakopsora pachyrhizi]